MTLACQPKPASEASVLAHVGGEGGIRTHVPLTGQDAFEAPPLRPLRYLSGRTTFDYTFPVPSIPARRLSRKNSWMIERHSSSSTPAVTRKRWFRPGDSSAFSVDTSAPVFGSAAP